MEQEKNKQEQAAAKQGSSPVDISQLSEEQKAFLLAQLNAEAKNERINKRDAYEGLRGEFMHKVEGMLVNVTADVKGFKVWLRDESSAFIKLMREYGQVGTDDPMYQLAMTLLERNQAGDLDYKSISKLYELEDKFNDPEYSEIMKLFQESNVVQKNATNYYFWKRDKETGVWRRIEPSFCRI